eukprot:CFRG5653T1
MLRHHNHLVDLGHVDKMLSDLRIDSKEVFLTDDDGNISTYSVESRNGVETLQKSSYPSTMTAGTGLDIYKVPDHVEDSDESVDRMLQRLKSENFQLKLQINEMDEVVSKDNDTISKENIDLKHQVAELEIKLYESEDMNSKSNQVSSLESQLDNVQKEKRQLNETVDRLYVQIKRLHEENTQLKIYKTDLTYENDANAEIVATIPRLKEDQNEREKIIAELRREISDVRSDNEELKLNLVDCTASLEKEKARLRDITLRYDELMESLLLTKDELKIAKLDAQNYAMEEATLREKHIKSSDRTYDLEGTLDEQLRRLSALRAENQSLEETVKESLAERITLESDKENITSELEALQIVLSEKDKENSRLSLKCAELQRSVSSGEHAAEKRNLQREVEGLRYQCEQEKRRRETLREESEQHLQFLESQIEDITSEYDKSTAVLKGQYVGEIDGLQMEVRSLVRQFQAESGRSLRYATMYEDVKRNEEDVRGEIMALREELRVTEADQVELASTKLRYEAEIDVLRSKIAQGKHENSELLQSFKELETQLADLLTMKTETNAQIDELKDIIQEKNDLISEKMAESANRDAKDAERDIVETEARKYTKVCEEQVRSLAFHVHNLNEGKKRDSRLLMEAYLYIRAHPLADDTLDSHEQGECAKCMQIATEMSKNGLSSDLESVFRVVQTRKEMIDAVCRIQCHIEKQSQLLDDLPGTTVMDVSSQPSEKV